MRLCVLAVTAALVGSISASAPAIAQNQCAEGRTVAGACVDVPLSSAMRERVRVFTQPRLSYSGPAVAPSRDRQYDALRDWGQALRAELYGPCGAQFCP